MIYAIGVDVVDIPRFRAAVERWSDRFISKILTADEIRHCRSKAGGGILSMAVRFAAKEAFIKCLNEEEYRHFTWQQVEVSSAPTGKPSLCLKGGLAQMFAGYTLFVSLSHSDQSAIAMVVIEKLAGHSIAEPANPRG
jgi:holo-[acyl-carrier protein] synthase